jgi:hypothetical protein
MGFTFLFPRIVISLSALTCVGAESHTRLNVSNVYFTFPALPPGRPGANIL